jgi:hypothetical protein
MAALERVMTAAEIYWLRDLPTGRLAVMPRPRGDDWLPDEVSNWHAAGLNTIVSLLESHEVKELGLAEEHALCRSAGIEFISFPVVDRGVPASAREVLRLVDNLVAAIRRGSAVGIHCRAGIGRSGLLVACVLSRLGVPEKEVFPRISQARGVRCPDTEAQTKWFASFLRHGENAL